jgi:hypothetical protein
VRLLTVLAICTNLIFCAHALATTYYVNSTMGSDGNSGMSPEAAWHSIARVNRAQLRPGDSVLFCRGGLWRETLRPSSSGSAASHITFGAYGKGTKPVITGSDPAEGWMHEGDSMGYLLWPHPTPASLWKHDARLTWAVQKADLRNENQWWYDHERHRIYILAPGAPSQIEVQVRDIAIDANDQSYVIYEGLDLRHVREGLRVFSWRKHMAGIILRNCNISTEPSAPHGTMSAGVYASVEWGAISDLRIRDNVFTPYPVGLEHWGIYFVKGVSSFVITGNRFAPAGEDAITIWHCNHGILGGNSGGGNGENTIDVKDSEQVVIRDNQAVADGEYNIVVHSVDEGRIASHITVVGNRCERGGQGRQLTAGIALLFVRDSSARDNYISHAYGAGIFENDRLQGAHNKINGNLLADNGTGQDTGAITLEDVSGTRVDRNVVDGQGASGFAVRVEGGANTTAIEISENLLFPRNGQLIEIGEAARGQVVLNRNSYFAAAPAIFHVGSASLDFQQWQGVTQDAGSRLLLSEEFPFPVLHQ